MDQGVDSSPLIPYTTKVIEKRPVQLSSISKIDGQPSLVVDYFPIHGTTKYMCKVLRFRGVDTMGTKCITKREFERECEERIDMGYTVTGFNTEYSNMNPMAGAC
jgi:hypothetical protein